MSEIPRPLKLAWFQILLSLAERELHGYAIQRAVLERTDGQLTLWPAMLYRSLAKLEEAGLIAQIDPPEDEPEDERRQYYGLTRAGQRRLAEEVELMASWVKTARSIHGRG